MPLFRTSMRTSLGLVVLIMGALGMVLAIATAETYRHLAFENQRAAFVELAKLKIDDLLNGVIQEGIELGTSAQANPRFRRAFRVRDTETVATQLDEHFHRAFVTLSVLKLARLYAFDRDFHFVGASHEGDQALSDPSSACRSLINEAAPRQGAERLKPLSRLCIEGGYPYLNIIVPIGGLRLQGYLILAIDPINNLAKAGNGLGMPLTIALSDGRQGYVSDHWPTNADENTLMAGYNLKTPNGETFLHFTFASDISQLRQQLAETRNLIFAAASIAMLVTGIIALIILQHTALTPLRSLTNHLHRVRHDKSHLGERVLVRGNAEIVGLAEDFNDMSGELHTLYNTLETMAFTDALTDLPNRALFYDHLQQALLSAERNKIPFALFVMDLDRFKYVNDTLGHQVGDQLLQEVGERLKGLLRKSDTVARLGGDEFAALLLAVENDQAAEMVAEKIAQALNRPIELEGHSLTVGVSIGIVHSPRDGNESNQLVQRADIAMYQAKRHGWDYATYNAEMAGENLFAVTMEAELREAIRSNAFELYYQPKISMRRGHIIGTEALIRWNHPQHGFIPPDKFIPLAEQTGLIQPLTQWVLSTALTQCGQWLAKGISLGVAVNLSAHNLTDQGTIDMVQNALRVSGVEPHWLTLELTETSIMTDAAKALVTLGKLADLGVRLAVDDFGTGYSSLAYLKRLPVDEIKIDRSFVMDMAVDANDAVIVRSTIDLAHNMGLRVVAEGIETQEIWNMLTELNCDQGQGFLMGRPVPHTTLGEWLAESPWGLDVSA
jgi:diguanylate cyclase (GGDEF)-like protein